MFTVYKRLKWYFVQEKWAYIFMAVLLTSLSVITIFPPIILGLAIDDISQSTITVNALIIYSIGLILIPVIRYFFDMAYHYLVNSRGLNLSYILRRNYLRKLISSDAVLFEKFSKGDLISRATNDMDSLTQAATSTLQDILYNVVLFIVVTTTMVFYINWKLTLATAFIAPLAIFGMSRLFEKIRRLYERHRKFYADMTESIISNVEGIKVIRAYGQEENTVKKVHESIEADIDSWRGIVRVETLIGPLFQAIGTIPLAIALSYGFYLIVMQELSPGQLVAFLALLGYLVGPFASIGNIINGLNAANIAQKRYFEILDHQNEIVVLSENENEVIKFDKINYENVSFKYPYDDQYTLKNISFEIRKGQTIGVVGPAGSGKSTLLRQLFREFEITSGEIYIDERPIKEFTPQALRNLVGVVMQSHTLFSTSVSENLVIGNPEASEFEIRNAMQIADFEKDIKYLDDGLFSKIQEGGTNLSGGQKQRLSIARAVVKNPEILILDDSLSAVDTNTEKTIVEQLSKYRGDKTNIILTHRFSAIRNADVIYVIKNGRVVECGSHAQLIRNDGWYFEQYKNQRGVE